MKRTATQTSVKPSGLVGYWKFNELGNVVIDRSGCGNNGSIIGASRLGDGLSFNGSTDYVTVPNLSSYPNGKGALSISTWIKFSGVSDEKHIIGWWNNYNNNIRTGTNKVYFRINADETKLVFSDSFLNDNVEHHVVATYDKNGGSNNVKLYIDSVLQSTLATTTGNLVSNDNFSMGAITDAGIANLFTGSIYKPRLYNYAITQETVTEIYRSEI